MFSWLKKTLSNEEDISQNVKSSKNSYLFFPSPFFFKIVYNVHKLCLQWENIKYFKDKLYLLAW